MSDGVMNINRKCKNFNVEKQGVMYGNHFNFIFSVRMDF